MNAADIKNEDIIRRIWQKDYTLWEQEPTEITDRLGWLTITEAMRKQVPVLKSFADEIVSDGFHHIVLLGMGGSSLGAEVFRQVFGSTSGFPGIIVLDSTLPDAVQAVTDSIDPARTLFVVSSKSGTTTEPNMLYKYFRSLVAHKKRHAAKKNFIAITDPGTPLESLGAQEEFRYVFLNAPDIGGRYSVLSYFGIVPASLIGINIGSVLERAEAMKESCASCVPPDCNPAFWLGEKMANMALKGRDKLTLVTSPSMKSFGLWAEQLIAESTGKEGKGIVPVAGEPLLSPEKYGDDRLFVYLRLNTDDNSITDAAIESLKESGQPMIVLEMKDRYDIGAEFFRWEFATAVAGYFLGIHPFNQPNVQQAKDTTEKILTGNAESRQTISTEPVGSPAQLFTGNLKNKYFSIQAYLRQTPGTDDVFAGLRRKVMEQYQIATTLGYGPRFLHSTGQLHKGGPNTGLFLQIVTGHDNDITIPGEQFTFGTVADAQALGDFEALRSLGRQVVRLHLKNGDEAMLRAALTEQIQATI